MFLQYVKLVNVMQIRALSMNYFDDLKVTFVGRTLSCKDSTCIGPHNYFGLGIMEGKDHVLRALPCGKMRIKTPFVYMIQPSETSGWMTADGALRDNRWFIVDGVRAEWLVTSLKEIFDPRICTCELSDYSELIMIHQNMLQLYHSANPSKNYKLSAMVENFIAAIYDAIDTPGKQAPMQELITRITNRITERPGENLDVESIVKGYNISYDHFRRCFTEYMGVPLHEFVLQKRFSLALSLLRSGMRSIKEIADDCGFQNSSDFARFIKKRSNTTPSELRKKPQFMEI